MRSIFLGETERSRLSTTPLFEERKSFFESFAQPEEGAEHALPYHHVAYLPPASEVARLHEIPKHASKLQLLFNGT